MRIHRRRGVSLLEVLFSIMVVTASAGVLMALMPSATVAHTKSSLAQRAMGLAQKEMEAVRGLGYANANASQLYSFGLIDSPNPVSANTYSFTLSDAANNDSTGQVLPTGTGTVKLEQVDIDLIRVTVVVAWSDRGVARSFSTGTLVANL